MKVVFLFLSVILAFPAFAQESGRSPQTQFEGDSENAVEETVEVKDGKTVRQIRSGKVRQRKGEARVGEIEEGEVNKIARRQKSLSLTAFGFGPYGSADVGDDKMLYGFSYGHHWEVTTTAEITADLLGAVNGEGSFWHGGIGFSFLPLTTSISPIFGVALGFGYADGDEKNVGGFSGQGNVGMRFFRLSETQMEILANYTAVFAEPTPGIFGAQLRILY